MRDDGYGDNIKFRAQHGALDLRKVKQGISGRVTVVGLEDGLHAAMRESLKNNNVYDEAMALRRGFDALVGGLGFKTSNPEAIGRCTKNGEMSQGGAALYADYCAWYAECKRQHLAPKLCVNIICHDYSARQADKDNHLASGTSMAAVVKCLDVFKKIKNGKNDR